MPATLAADREGSEGGLLGSRFEKLLDRLNEIERRNLREIDVVVKYCFDIDGTLCTNTWGEYEKAEPFPELIAKVNALYDAGHRILLFTARGTETGIDWKELTERQMREWGLRYHSLLLGKPNADVYVDDRAINVRDWRG